VAAEALQQGGMAFRHQVQCVAQVQAADRAPRAFQFAVIAGGEGDYRAVEFVLEARRQDADHALVPVGIKQAQGMAFLHHDVLQRDQRAFLHVSFDFAAFAVEAVQFRRHARRLAFIVA
jgi:hypothetical protein